MRQFTLIFDADQIVLLGHSLGGCIAAIVAGLDKRISKLILWSPVARPLEDIVGIIGEELYSECLQNKVVNYHGFEVGLEFLASLSSTRPLEKIQNFFGKVLLFTAAGMLRPLSKTRICISVRLARNLKLFRNFR